VWSDRTTESGTFRSETSGGLTADSTGVTWVNKRSRDTWVRNNHVTNTGIMWVNK